MKLFTIIVTLLTPFISNAQSNYKPGYVVKAKGDTIKGYINFKEWSRSPKSVSLKTDLQTAPVKFTPHEIVSFTVTGFETFISYVGPLSADKNQFPNIPFDLDTTTIQDSVFLKLITTGKHISLYSQNDNIKTRFFIKEAESDPVELLFHSYQEGSSIKSATPYKNLLVALAAKYAVSEATFLETLNSINFYLNDLVKIVIIINGSKYIESNKVHYKNKHFFVGAGYNHSITTFSEDGVQSKASTTHSPKFTVGIDLYNRPAIKKLIFRTELSYFSISPEFLKPSMYSYYQEYYHFTQHTVSITEKFIYNIYNQPKFKFYAALGAGMSFCKYTNNELINASKSSLIKTNPYYLFPRFVKIPVEVGVFVNKRINLSLEYLHNTAIGDFSYSNRDIITKALNMNLNYFFGKQQ